MLVTKTNDWALGFLQEDIKLTPTSLYHLLYPNSSSANKKSKMELIEDLINCYEKYDKKSKKYKVLDTLSEINTFDMNAWRWIKIQRKELQEICRRYTDNVELWSEEATEFIVGRLIFAEFIATYELFYCSNLPYFLKPLSPNYTIVWRGFKKIYKWTFRAIVIYLCVDFKNVYLLGGYIAWIINSEFTDYMATNARNKIIQQMYSTLKVLDFRHTVNFGLLLEKIKNDYLNYPIHWDHEVYTLLEKVINRKMDDK